MRAESSKNHRTIHPGERADGVPVFNEDASSVGQGYANTPGEIIEMILTLPDEGTLLFATDLQGNRRDYERLKSIYEDEARAGSRPFLLFCGDLVHGPSPDMNELGQWPDYLGTPFVDESVDILLDYLAWSREARTASLMGNHEHAHIGGPQVAKFYEDEAAVLDAALGGRKAEVHTFLNTWPLIAVSSCGARFIHAAPRATEPNLDTFRRLSYAGYEQRTMNEMYDLDTLSQLLWARTATDEQALAFLHATGEEQGFVGYGHNVTQKGYVKTGSHQICASTSYGLFDADKVFLRLDLSARYDDVNALREGVEIQRLYP